MVGFSIPNRGPAFKLAALALVISSLSATGFWMYHFLKGPDLGQPSGAGDKPSSRLFQHWPKDRQPDLVLLLSGETFSYLQPCGCSHPQHGGLARRYNFIQGLVKERHWPVVALDLGDVAQKSGPQTLLKYTTMMTALKTMGYTAVGIGRNEMAIPLIDALSEYALNNPLPRVLAANLLKKEENFPMMVKSFEVVATKGAPRVGVVGVVHPNVGREVNDPSVKFDDVEKTLKGTLTEMAGQKPEVMVLLFQGTIAEAKKLATQIPQFQVVLCLSPEPDPPDKPEAVGKTLIFTVGQKGRYLGTVGLFRTGNGQAPLEMYYQLVLLTPDYETPQGQEASNPLHALMEEYSHKVKDDNYLAQYPKALHPIQRDPAFKEASYIGSDKCNKCHDHAYKVWKNSAHSHAYESLEKANRPSLRQFDGECVACHVIGFENKGGFTDEVKTPILKQVGCESCHGPGSLHAKWEAQNKPHPALLALMNPYKTPEKETPEAAKGRELVMDLSCQKCHDQDNDVHWSIKKWAQIVHNVPKPGNPKRQGQK